jgi:transposase
LDLALINTDATHQCEQVCILNTKKGLKEIAAWLKGFGVTFQQVLFCMEFTGLYNRPLQKYLDEQGAFLWMEMPVRIIRSIGLQRGKNDKIDAKRIALYASRHQQDKIKWVLPSQEKDAIADLIALRNRLITAKNMLMVPMKELEEMGEKKRSARIKNQSSKSVKYLENEIESTEEEIRNLIKKEPTIEKNLNLIITIPGVGPWTALNMICATDNFTRLNNPKQLACYCGCAPFEHRSGTSIRGKSRVSHMANKSLKTLLTLGATSIIHSKNELGDYYHRKVAEGKSKMSVINAVRNKIIHRIIAVVERQSPYIKYVAAIC